MQGQTRQPLAIWARVLSAAYVLTSGTPLRMILRTGDVIPVSQVDYTLVAYRRYDHKLYTGAVSLAALWRLTAEASSCNSGPQPWCSNAPAPTASAVTCPRVRKQDIGRNDGTMTVRSRLYD